MSDERRHELLTSALEACRIEVLGRLQSAGLPFNVEIQMTKVIDQENGWRTEEETATVNALHDPSVSIQIRDQSVSGIALGFGKELGPLADHLVETTDLADRPHPLMPPAKGATAVTARYLSRMVHHYLLSLSDLRQPDEQLGASLREQLDELCEQPPYRRVQEVAVAGVTADSILTHRDIALRPLTAHERGAAVGSHPFPVTLPGSEFVPPTRWDHFVPTALLSITGDQKDMFFTDDGMLAHRVALAFHLKGFELASSEVISSFYWPRWSSTGYSYGPFPLGEASNQDRQMDREQFAEIVDLAFKMPALAGEEGSGEEIVLFRALRGLGTAHSEASFLDLAIALEAALLGGSQTELSYKFRLFGALFLRHERSPEVTFDALKTIYEARSKLVHGTKIRRQERMRATEMARDLVKAIVLKAVEDGWPDPTELTRIALSAP